MNRNIIPYNPKLKDIAKRLRKESTLSEIKLWRYLKGKQMKGYDFHRQKPIDEFIVDFYCSEMQLAIEIDGVTHDYKLEKDKIRQQRLESLGVNFLRFLDSDVRDNLEGVLLVIEEWIEEHTPSGFACHPSQEGINNRESYFGDD